MKQKEWELTPEQEAIVAAVRPDPGGDQRIRELLRQGLDWQALRRIALYHGVFPVVFVRLERIGEGLIPKEEEARLKDLYRANARRSLMMTAELLKVLGFLESRGIDAIPFKGPVLAVQAYGDSGLRQFGDLDILVRSEDLHKARQLLKEQGYAPYEKFTAAQERAHLKRASEFTFIDRKGTMSLDLHWRLAAEYLTAKLDTDTTFARRSSILLEGRPVPALPADDMVLYLCLHGAKHVWSKLSALCDVAALIETNRDLDWQGLFRKAETAGLRRVFLLGVGLVRDVLAVELPTSVAGAIDGDGVVTSLRENVKAKLFGRGCKEPGFLETARLQLLVKDGFVDRARYCFMSSFLPMVEDWKLVPLPDNFYFLYFIIRPLRLAILRPWRGRTSPSGSSDS